MWLVYMRGGALGEYVRCRSLEWSSWFPELDVALAIRIWPASWPATATLTPYISKKTFELGTVLASDASFGYWHGYKVVMELWEQSALVIAVYIVVLLEACW